MEASSRVQGQSSLGVWRHRTEKLQLTNSFSNPILTPTPPNFEFLQISRPTVATVLLRATVVSIFSLTMFFVFFNFYIGLLRVKEFLKSVSLRKFKIVTDTVRGRCVHAFVPTLKVKSLSIIMLRFSRQLGIVRTIGMAIGNLSCVAKCYVVLVEIF